MSAPKDEPAPVVRTIGHSTRTLAEFIGLPQAHGATAAAPVIAFLSGGQSGELASTSLNAMNVMEPQLPIPTIGLAGAMRDMSVFTKEREQASGTYPRAIRRFAGDRGKFLTQLGRRMGPENAQAPLAQGDSWPLPTELAHQSQTKTNPKSKLPA
jgi:hypothetical protein